MTSRAWFFAVATVAAVVWLVGILVSGHGAGDDHGVQPGLTIAYVIVAIIVFPILMAVEISRNKRDGS